MPTIPVENITAWARHIAEHRLLHGHQRFAPADSPSEQLYGVTCVACLADPRGDGFYVTIPLYDIRFGQTTPWLNRHGTRQQIHQDLLDRVEAIVDQAAHSGSPGYHPDAWAPGYIYSYWHPEVVVSHIQPDVTLEEIDAGWPIYVPSFWERL